MSNMAERLLLETNAKPGEVYLDTMLYNRTDCMGVKEIHWLVAQNTLNRRQRKMTHSQTDCGEELTSLKRPSGKRNCSIPYNIAVGG